MSSYMKFETALFLRAIMSGMMLCAAYRIFCGLLYHFFGRRGIRSVTDYFILAGSRISTVFCVVSMQLRGTSTVFIARCANWCFFCKLFVKSVAISGKKM